MNMGGVCSSEVKVAKQDNNQEVDAVVNFFEPSNVSVRATRGKDSEEESMDDEVAPAGNKPSFTIHSKRSTGIGNTRRKEDTHGQRVGVCTLPNAVQPSEEDVRRAWSMDARRDPSKESIHAEMDNKTAKERTLKRTTHLSGDQSLIKHGLHSMKTAQGDDACRFQEAFGMNAAHASLPHVPDDPLLKELMDAMGAYRPSSASFSRHK